MRLLPRFAAPLAALLLVAAVPPTAEAVGWVTGPPLSPGDRFARDPSTGVTPSGERIVAWEQQTATQASEGIAVRIAPPTGDFGDQTLIPGSAGAFFPVVATGPDDNVALAWLTPGMLHVAVRAPGATGFTEATPIAVTDAISPPEVLIQGGTVFLGLQSANSGGSVQTTAVSAFELPAGKTAVQPITGQSVGGAIDFESYNRMSDTPVLAVRPKIALAGGRLNFVWQRVHGSTAAAHATASIEVATRSVGGGGPIGATTPAAVIDQGTGSASDLQYDVTGRGDHAYVAWAGPDALSVRDIAADGSSVQTIPVRSVSDVRAGVDAGGTLTVAWDDFDQALSIERVGAATVPAGGQPGPPTRVSAPNANTALADVVVAADGTRLVLVDRAGDGSDDDVTGHVQGLFAAPVGDLGSLEEVSGVQDRTGFAAFNEARAALGGGRAIAVSSADDQSGTPNQRVYLAERDATPPAFGAISVPDSATPGTRIAFAAGATDALTPVQIDWDFGDGSSARGAAVTHAYGAPGHFTVTARAHDAAGNVAVQTRSVVVAARPGRGGTGASPIEPDRRAPVVAKVTTTNARFRVGAGSTDLLGAAATKSPAGTVFRVSVDERSTLVLSFTGKLAGRKKGSRCIAGRRTGKACTIAVVPGTLLRTSRGAGCRVDPLQRPHRRRAPRARLVPARGQRHRRRRQPLQDPSSLLQGRHEVIQMYRRSFLCTLAVAGALTLAPAAHAAGWAGSPPLSPAGHVALGVHVALLPDGTRVVAWIDQLPGADHHRERLRARRAADRRLRPVQHRRRRPRRAGQRRRRDRGHGLGDPRRADPRRPARARRVRLHRGDAAAGVRGPVGAFDLDAAVADGACTSRTTRPRPCSAAEATSTRCA